MGSVREPATLDEPARRYRALGGLAGWRVPLIVGVIALGVALAGHWTFACMLAAAGLAARGVDRAVVLDVSTMGLSRGVAIAGAFVTPARVIAWRAVEEIATSWRGPRDFTALETVVTSREAGTIHFSSRMGYAAYRALLAEVARRAPRARRTGLTDEVLAEDAPPVRRMSARVVAVLAVAGFLLAVALIAWV
jgi:hypothetical protein